MVVIAAIDRSDRAQTVLSQAATLAEKFGDSIHAVHVMKRSEVVETEGESISKGEVTDLDELRDRAAAVAAEVIEDHPVGVETETVGLIGNPADEIVRYAEERDAQYVVVGPRRRSQTGKILFGSVAQDILLNAPSPVVSVMNH